MHRACALAVNPVPSPEAAAKRGHDGKKTYNNPLDRHSAGTTAAVAVTETLNPSQIRRDGGTQMRPALDMEKVGEYAELLVDGVDLGALAVIYDGTNHWLWDGFHRLGVAHTGIRSREPHCRGDPAGHVA